MSEFVTSFDRFASEYDKAMSDSGDYSHQHTLDPMIYELIGEPNGLSIYDIACGNGYMGRNLAKQGANVYGSDISDELVNIAKTKYPTDGFAGMLTFGVHDASDFSHVPIKDFDVAIMNMAIFYISDLDCFLSGLHSVLRPGGRFIFTLDHPFRHLVYKVMGYEPDVEEEARRYPTERVETSLNHWTGVQDLIINRRPVSSYVNACGRQNLPITRMIEPRTKVRLESGAKFHTPIPFKMALEATKV